MSFFKFKDYIEEGDLVLAFISRGTIKPITVTKGALLNTRYGHYEHDKMIGLKYGEQMGGEKGYGFIHLLHPTPEMWTLSLPHRTQIVYTPDSSYIMQRLGVTSGSRIIEAGTGSASFSHSFARAIGLDGRLFTYEFHEPRYLEAKKELEGHGLVNTHITHRDVCNDGFEIEVPANFGTEVNGDVVFLDLPSPWTAIPHLPKVISKVRQVGICCFSPCIEQVAKTVEALQQNGWTNIEMVEVAGRRWEARKDMVRDIKDVVKRLKDIQSRKNQGIENRRHAKVIGEKRDHSEVLPEPSESSKVQNTGKGFNPFGKGIRIREGDEQFQWRNVTKIETEVKSHTSYLTFAYMLPERVE
ncbi:translational repressor of GCN4 [Suhomyces tanzawaensis NRRL Y-17324]|uniref:tRNA (adenine(58)-N(1))-methyltransferase catalytic subunit TRM61 n=1 Tax=Suhomyces tanzawaensis NRRL Y-17324 TaxID=984487 RepID=A0A1E4SFW5_9ASCO|nr:translational repressor of GCN4 [Suhomyces tanzawaensis NRRL Y-17324]ODV78355.1 translational repressor of GCN4 [Suhomyces tanzawaensis NRRL Y-17324]